jgi:hypothetical protein
MSAVRIADYSGVRNSEGECLERSDYLATFSSGLVTTQLPLSGLHRSDIGHPSAQPHDFLPADALL